MLKKLGHSFINFWRQPYLFLILYLFYPQWAALWASTTVEKAVKHPTIRVKGKRLRSEGVNKSSTIVRQKQSSIVEMLEQVPQVQIVRHAGQGAEASFIVRGHDPIQNRYFLNGIPLNDSQFQQGSLDLVPIEAIGSVSVYAGGPPVLFGADGFGGSINLDIVNSPIDVGGEFGIRTGSYGYQKAFGKMGWKGNGGFIISVERSKENYSYYENNGTPLTQSDDRILNREGNGFERLKLLPFVTLYSDKNSKLELISLNVISHHGVPGPTTLPTSGDLNRFYHLGALDWGLQTGEITGKLYWKWDNQDLKNFSDPLYGEGPQRSTQLSLGSRWKLEKKISKQIDIKSMLGVDWDRYRFQVNNALFQENKRLLIPLGVKLEGKWGRFRFTPAILTHYSKSISSDSSERSSAEVFVSPRLGISYQPLSTVRLRTSVGRYHRLPSLFELYGAPNSVAATPELKTEQANQGELGIDVSTNLGSLVKQAKLSYTYSRSLSSNLINYVQNSQATVKAVNIGEAFLESHILNLEMVLPEAISLGTGLYFLNSKNQGEVKWSQGKEIPLRPSIRGHFSLAYNPGRFSFSYRFTWLGERFLDLANLNKLRSVGEHGLRVGFKTDSFGTFDLSLENITNELAIATRFRSELGETLSSGVAGYPTPGRRVYLSWSLNV